MVDAARLGLEGRKILAEAQAAFGAFDAPPISGSAAVRDVRAAGS